MIPKKVLLVVCDGLGDRPCKELNSKTPLEAARKLNLNELANKGACGLMHVLGQGIKPGSDTAHLSIFGYNIKKHYPGRGPLEALGIKMMLQQGDVALRANIATLARDGTIADRRAFRSSAEPAAKLLDGIEIDGVKFLVKAGTAHRLAIVMRGKGLSANISDSDPHREQVRPLKVKPLDDSKEAEFTANVLNKFLEKARKILEKESSTKANAILTRGAGIYFRVESFEERYGLKAACIAGAGLYKGIARFLGFDVFDVERATGTIETDINAKITKALELLQNYDFVFVHIKGCDIAGHDGNAKLKRNFIERIDSALKPLLKLEDTLIVITADHSTPCVLKDHSGDAVPVLICGSSVRSDSVASFDERSCANGYYRFMHANELMREIINLLGRSKIVGS